MIISFLNIARLCHMAAAILLVLATEPNMIVFLFQTLMFQVSSVVWILLVGLLAYEPTRPSLLGC